MPRIFLTEIPSIEGVITIKGEKARYLSSVLRCSKEDRILITDDKGNSYSAKIINISKKEATVEILDEEILNRESPLRITLLQGILKSAKMDLVIQKTTELGVHKIVPVITERSQLRETRKQPRWQKIAEEASRQSGRNIIPVISEPVEFERAFIQSELISGKGVIFWEEAGEKLTDVVEKIRHADSVNLFIGPEGGFSEKEVHAARENGFVIASLGRRILRAETAAIAATSIIQYELGDISQ